MIFTATISSAFDGIFDKVALGVDTQVSPKDSNSSGVPDSVLTQLQDNKSELGIAKILPTYSGPATIAKEDGKALQTGGAPSIGSAFVPPDQRLSDTESNLIEGRAPEAPNEVALNESSADEADLEVGSTTKVATSRGSGAPMEVTVVGILDVPGATSGFTNVQFLESTAQELFTDGSHSQAIDLQAVPGVSPDELKSRVAGLLGDDYKLRTGDEVRQDEKDNVNQFLDVFNYILLAFAAIGLIVGTFIIYNTFSMIVAQRVRELALLRAIGASRKQVTRSVLLEAFVVGLIGALVGLAAGIGIAALLRALTASTGLPSTLAAGRSVVDHRLPGGGHRCDDGQRVCAGPAGLQGVAGRGDAGERHRRSGFSARCGPSSESCWAPSQSCCWRSVRPGKAAVRPPRSASVPW